MAQRITQSSMDTGSGKMNNRGNPFKGKRFVLTHWALAVLGGSENNILQLAEYIKERGGLVEFFTYAFDDPLKKIINEKNIPVRVDDIDLFDQLQKTEIRYDLSKTDFVIICQNTIPIDIIKQLNDKAIKTKFIFFHMSSHIGLAMESPLFYDLESKIASKILTISEETTTEQIERLLGNNIQNLVYYRNPVPDSFIDRKLRADYPKIPKKIAVISNHPPEEVVELVHDISMKSKKVKIEFIGRWSNNPKLVTAGLLSKYDVVVSIGKTVQYCLVMGIPVYIYDRFGGQGYVTDYDAAKRRNFSGRDAGKKTTDVIADELLKEYKTAVKYQEENIEFFRKEFLLSNVAPLVFNDKEDVVLNNNFSQQYINYLISIQLLLKEKYSTMIYSGNMQKKLDNMDSQVMFMKKEILERDSELRSFLSVKRSARLLMGNIKRRILHDKTK